MTRSGLCLGVLMAVGAGCSGAGRFGLGAGCSGAGRSWSARAGLSAADAMTRAMSATSQWLRDGEDGDGARRGIRRV
jgi:hypothetical protein